MNRSDNLQLSFRWAPGEQTGVAESPTLIIRTCRHILDSGRLCRQPAVGGRRHCRHHIVLQIQRHRMARARRRAAVVKLPRLTNPRAVEAAHTVVRVASAGGRMDADRARLVHRALRQVASAMRFIAWQNQQTLAFGSPRRGAFLPRRQQGP